MKRSNTHSSPLAILTSNLPTAAGVGTAVCALDASSTDGWCQLLPAGPFAAVDGRPTDVPSGQWLLTAEIATGLIAQVQARVNPLTVDYEHQSLNTLQNGQPAPAAGRFNQLEWRESGLWIKPQWTARAADFIKNGEYSYLSAVFPYDKATGQVLGLHSAALTNTPGLDGLAAVALSQLATHFNTPTDTTQPEHSMNELLLALLKQLGIDPGEQTEFDKTLADKVSAALTQLQSQAASATTLATEVTSLKATGAAPDPAKFVPIAALTELQAQVAKLSANQQQDKTSQLIATALEDGRLLPSLKDWAEQLGKQDAAALTSYLDNAQPLAALKGMQSGGKQPEQTSTAALTADEKEAARLSGMSEKEYLDAKALT